MSSCLDAGMGDEEDGHWANESVDDGVPGRRVGTPGGPGKRQVGLRTHPLGNRPDELIWGER